MSEFRIDVRGVPEVKNLLRQVDKGAPRAVVMGVNKAAAKMRT